MVWTNFWDDSSIKTHGLYGYLWVYPMKLWLYLLWILLGISHEIVMIYPAIWFSRVIYVGLPEGISTYTGMKTMIPGFGRTGFGRCNLIMVGGAITILKNDGVRQEGWHPMYEMENKIHVPSHQPVLRYGQWKFLSNPAILWNFVSLGSDHYVCRTIIKYHKISGWWFQPSPLKNMSQLGWWHSQLNGKIKFMFQTTNQFVSNPNVVDDESQKSTIPPIHSHLEHLP